MPHILLEGSQDKAFFEILLQTIEQVPKPARAGRIPVAITTSETIKSDTAGEGNRQKVERICKLVAYSSFRQRFVGFVDREFRKFTFGDRIDDNLATQRRLGRLVWSRGHSIENYVLDFEVVRQPLYDFSTNGQVALSALKRLQENFQTILNIACALGLAARDAHEMETVRRTVHWETVGFVDSTVRWDIDRWRVALVQHSHLTLETSDNLVRQFEHWLDAAQSSNPVDVRWACDGHIGLNLIWTAYARFIYDISGSEDGVGGKATNQRDALLGVNDNAKVNHLARRWAQTMAHTVTDTPRVCFDLVGVIA